MPCWRKRVSCVRADELGFHSSTSTQREFYMTCQQIFQQKRVKLTQVLLQILITLWDFQSPITFPLILLQTEYVSNLRNHLNGL
jgi:hypothetical protein